MKLFFPAQSKLYTTYLLWKQISNLIVCSLSLHETDWFHSRMILHISHYFPFSAIVSFPCNLSFPSSHYACERWMLPCTFWTALFWHLTCLPKRITPHVMNEAVLMHGYCCLASQGFRRKRLEFLNYAGNHKTLSMTLKGCTTVKCLLSWDC